MEPVTLILSALAAGVASGVADTVTQSVRDGYEALRNLLVDKFSGNKKALEILEDHASEPEIYEKPLANQLLRSGADQDPNILAIAKSIVLSANSAGIKTKYQVNVLGGRVGNIGDNGTVTMN